MGKKLRWLIVSGLLVLSLILASCGQTPVTTAPTTTPITTGTTTSTTKPTTTPTTGTTKPTTSPTTTTSVNKPVYGGSLVTLFSNDVDKGFDPSRYGFSSSEMMGTIIYEALGIGDWAKGAGGTKQGGFHGGVMPIDILKGALAESWEVSADALTYTFHLRKGIKWQNKAPVNGRELVASDVKFCLDRLCGIGNFVKDGPSLNWQAMESVVEVTAPDKYTVVIKCSTFDFSFLPYLLDDLGKEIYPSELLALPGGLNDWRNVVGSGAFILADHVPGSSMTLKKNPDYWCYDELNPEYKLPYLDEIKYLIVPDTSTQVSAMRTKKADTLNRQWLDPRTADELKASNPEMQIGPSNWTDKSVGIFMQLDIKPFNDLRVRKALQMAINIPAMNKLAQAEIEPYPSVLNSQFGTALYTPFDQLPQVAKENLTYNPTKAKQLLAEAGYPNGLTFECIDDPSGGMTQLLEAAVDQWSKVGVTVKIKTVTAAVHTTMRTTGTYPETAHWNYASVGPKPQFDYLFGPTRNLRYNDPSGDEQWNAILANKDEASRNTQMKKLNYYVLENALFVFTTTLYPKYGAAQPWVKGWHGEGMLRRGSEGSVLLRLWLDQPTKKAQAGR